MAAAHPGATALSSIRLRQQIQCVGSLETKNGAYIYMGFPRPMSTSENAGCASVSAGQPMRTCVQSLARSLKGFAAILDLQQWS